MDPYNIQRLPPHLARRGGLQVRGLHARRGDDHDLLRLQVRGLHRAGGDVHRAVVQVRHGRARPARRAPRAQPPEAQLAAGHGAQPAPALLLRRVQPRQAALHFHLGAVGTHPRHLPRVAVVPGPHHGRVGLHAGAHDGDVRLYNILHAIRYIYIYIYMLYYIIL